MGVSLLLQTTATPSLIIQGHGRQWSVAASVSFHYGSAHSQQSFYKGHGQGHPQGALEEKEGL